MNNGPTDEFKPTVNDRLRKSRERLAELRAESQAKARRAVRITNNYAHDHPWRMVITGAALAFTAGLLINTKPRRRIVVKQQKPVIKVKAPKPEKKHSPFAAIHALVPLVMLGLKAYTASRPHNKIEPHGPVDPSAPTP